MKNLFILIIFVILESCAGTGMTNQQYDSNSYLVKKIDRDNEWFIIIANRNDSTFMIVSKKPQIINPDWEKIKIGNYYKFKLKSIIPVINGVKMIPVNYLDFEGIYLDEKTIVNINPEKGIYDIYSSENLKGLFLIK